MNFKYLKIHMYFLFLLLLSLKFFIARIIIFEDYNLFTKVWLELGYFILLLGLVELFIKKGKALIFLFVNILVSLLLFSIILYYEFFGILVTHHALYQLHQVGDVKESIWTLLKPSQFLFFIDILILSLVAIIYKNPAPVTFKSRTPLILLIILAVINIGFNLLYTNNENHYDSVTAAKKQGIVTFQLTGILSDLAGKNESVQSDVTNEQIRDLKNIKEVPINERHYYGVAENRNIIVVQFESLQNFAVGLEIDGQAITPNLNQLIDEGLYFPKVYQQIGAGNTSDAEFLLNTSLYPPGSRGASEIYGDRLLPSFPRLLKKDGYKSVTFHTNKVEFWNRNQMYPALGFDEYYDEEFFGTEDYILMGSSDEILYDKTFDVLKEFHDTEQKFYANVLTLTSHHPFDLPEEKRFLELPDRFNDTFINDYLTSVHYADKALGDFIFNLKEEGLWNNSLIVVFGDHSGVHHNKISDKDKDLLKDLIGREYWFIDRFNIPFIINAPDALDNEVIENVGGQIDFMPTIANLLGVSIEEQIHFGQDIVNNPNNLLGMRYYLAAGSLFNSEVLLTPEEENGTAYDLDTGEIIGDRSDYLENYNSVLKLLPTFGRS